MKLTGQAAIEAKRRDSSVELMAKWRGKTFRNVSERNGREVIERGGDVWADVSVPDGVRIEEHRISKTHDQIVAERHQRKLAGKGLDCTR